VSVSFWQSSHHAVACAVKACASNITAAAASSAWADVFEPATLPTVPTSYTTPYSLIPVNGSYYVRLTNSSDTSRPLPFVEFGLESSDPTLLEDGEADWMDVRIRVRVGLGAATANAINGQAILEGQALALCTIAATVASDYLRAIALAADPVANRAFGICSCDWSQRPLIDTTGPKQATGAGATAVYASAVLSVVQRQFAVAGLGQTATNP
jgi:hypothetical protein